MEPIKIEDNIREKLQEREIIPSNKAWDKLSIHLDSNTPKRGYRLKRYVIAAGFVGFIVLLSFIFKKGFNTLPEQVEIVEVPTQNEDLNIQGNDKILVIDSNDKKIEENKNTLVLEDRENKNNNNVVAIKNAPSTSNTSIIENVAKNQINNSEENIALEDSEEEDYINSKVDEVVAQVKALQEKEQSVSDEDIDALLLKAQKEIQSQSLMTNKKVDAMALLEVVESEMETTFRDKVFEALGDGFEKVRTAVVERNN